METTPNVSPVVEEVARGEGITLARGAKLFPSSRAAATNVSTLFRWLAVGVCANEDVTDMIGATRHVADALY